ncbi:hypothetical protein Pmani_008136 [Petrolisthes manimaculis]|nr:hypothetical protein Pmani_008136 [Petrolisthes manimaculis]
MERTAPLSQTQRMALLNLIKERDSIVNDKSTAPGIIEAKKRMWEEINLKFNSLYPDQQPRSTKQLKRSYDHVKRKVKDEDREFKKKIKVTGGGCPPTPPKPTEEITLAASMMTVDLAMGNNVFETFTLEPVHNSSAAVVRELQEEDVDDPGVPGVSGISYGNPANPTHPSESLISVPLPVASTSTSSSSSPTPRSPAVITATPHRQLNPYTPSVGSVTNSRPRNKIRYSAKDDAYMCRTRQEEYHRLKIAQMKEMHARENEYMDKRMALLTSAEIKKDEVHSKLIKVLAAAEIAFDAMGSLDDV